jgi:hypothetical protein
MVYYVATGGSDSNPGSPDAPFRTLARGVDAAGPGDTVVVEDGTYLHEAAVTGGDRSTDQASPVTLHNSGTPNAWITIQARHKWGAVLDCENLCDSYINLRNASYIVIQDFVITRGYKEAVHSNDAAHHIWIRGNRIEYIANRVTSTNLGLDGMYTNPNCHDFIIDGNVFHDIGRLNPNQLDHGLYLRGWDYTVTNNVFYNIPHGWSIQMADGLSNVLIVNNTFASPNASNEGGHIMMWNTQSHLVIRNNIFFRPVNHSIARYQSVVSDCTIDHNLIFGGQAIIQNAGGCTLASNQTGGDPLFIKPWTEPYDFHLLPGSTAIGTGLPTPAVIADFDGNVRLLNLPFDIGAYAFVPGLP